MNSNESQAITAEWLESRGFVCTKRGDLWSAHMDLSNTFVRVRIWSDGALMISESPEETVRWPVKITTTAALTRLLVALGVWPDERERRLEEALREIADAPRLTSLHEYSGELCDAKWTADVARAALEDK